MSGRDMAEVTRETLDAIKKATTEGVLVGTGIQGVDLSGLVSLVPVNVPARNNTSAFPRTVAQEGSQTATWRALLNINSAQSDAAVGMDYAGSLTKFDEQNVFAPYKPLAKAGRVTLDAVAVARNFADALSVAELQTLNQLFIDQDLHLINSQNWALGTTASPTLVVNEKGGELPEEAKVEVAVAARSGANYFLGGSAKASAGKEATAGEVTTNSITASIPAQKGAVAYDWFVGKKGGKLYYYTTTTVASVTIKTVPTEAEKLPNLPLLSAVAPAAEATLTTEASSSATKWYNGIIAGTLGAYGEAGPVKPGSGEAESGAVFIDNGGAKITAEGSSVILLDRINDELWANTQLSPTAYMVNSLQGDEISKLILESSAATTFLPPTDADARTNLAGGGYIGRYINKAAGGVAVNIEVHPRVAPGTIIARTDRVPFPGSNIGSVFEVRTQYDTMRFDYAAAYKPGEEGGGPRYDFEIRSMETLVNRAPGAQAIVANVA